RRGCRSAAIVAQLLFLAMLGYETAQGFAGSTNMSREQFAGSVGVALATQPKQHAVLFAGALQSASQVQLQPDITLAVVVDVTDYRHELRTTSAGVKRGVKQPVQPAPLADIAFVAQSGVIRLQDLFGLREVGFSEVGDGDAHHLRL